VNRATSTLQSRLLSGGALTMLARIYMMALILVINIIVAKSMSPADCGTFVLATNILVFVCLLAMGGLEQVSVKLIAGDAGRTSRATTRSLLRRLSVVFMVCLAAAGMIAVVALLGPVGTWLAFPKELTELVLGCAALLSVLKMLSVYLRSFHAVGSASLFDGRTGGVFNNSLLLLVMLVIPAARTQNSVLFTALAASLALSIPLALIQLRKVWKGLVFQDNGSLSPIVVKHFSYSMIFASSVPLLLTQLATQTEIDIWLSSTWLSREDTALYGLTRRLSIQTIVPLQILNLMISSSIAELYVRGQKVELQRMLQSTAAIAAIISFAAQFVLVLFHEPILEALFGRFYVQAGTILTIMVAGEVINAASGSCGLTLALTGKGRVLLTANVVCVIIQFFVGTWAVRTYGLIGLSIVTAAIRSILFISLWLLARAYVGVWTHPTLSPVKAFSSLS
jgi:O-antigen/teichoic acid export membrane protein